MVVEMDMVFLKVMVKHMDALLVEVECNGACSRHANRSKPQRQSVTALHTANTMGAAQHRGTAPRVQLCIAASRSATLAPRETTAQEMRRQHEGHVHISQQQVHGWRVQWRR